ncbi:MAG TPA: glycosyltransferase family 4 protein [Symbiobacteriaceae bacterium]
MPGKVTIYTVTLLSTDGTRPIIGGLERYLRDLALLMKSMGYEVDFLQNSTSGPWTSDYFGFPVRGVPVTSTGTDIAAFDRLAGDKVLYGWIGQQQSYKCPGISICHGIWWDHPTYSEWITDEIKRVVKPALQQSRFLVSVDTAFINWCRATIPAEVQGKLRYIPNYIDTGRFSPRAKSGDPNAITILYPRRIDFTRGIEVCYRLVPRVLQKYPQVKFKFAVDRNNEHLWQQFVAWVAAQPDRARIDYRTYSFDEISAAYWESDIVICPSQMSEGTSLSCLEGMSTGKAVLATVVGGLTDLILDRYNGRLTNTDDESIFAALCELIEDGALRRQLGETAALTAKAFAKERWERQWAELIAQVY